MLFILTGGIQTGKTRWLMRLIEELETRGTLCHGVVSPGVWRKSQSQDGSIEYEKLGIEAVLLPQGESLMFACRRDLVQNNDDYDPDWQSMKAGLGWVIPDTALEAVNRHFDGFVREATVAQREQTATEQNEQVANRYAQNRGLLVIDELGRLELVENKGFTSALRQLEAGPSVLYCNALAVVRSQLVAQAQKAGQWPQAENMLWRLSQNWGGMELIAPDAHGAERVISAVAGDAIF